MELFSIRIQRTFQLVSTVLVYNEADEGASEIHKISLSDNTFDSKQFPNCTLFGTIVQSPEAL